MFRSKQPVKYVVLRQTSREVLDKIKSWEGLELKAYKDIGGILTIGYGHTSAAGHPKVTEDMVISKVEAEAILIQDLKKYEQCVQSCVEVPLTDNQFGALVSFCYNVGTGSFKKSTLLKKLNQGRYDEVPNELMRWNKVKGKVSVGLNNRRIAECGLWAEGLVAAPSSTNVSSHDTSNVFNVDIITSIISSLSGLGGVFAGNGIMQYAFAFIMVAASGGR